MPAAGTRNRRACVAEHARGVEPWTQRADAFSVYFGLFARLAPPHWTRCELLVRRPFSAAAKLPILPAVALLVCTAIGTTSFDGFSIHSQWTGIAQMLQDALEGLGLSIRTALRAFTIGP